MGDTGDDRRARLARIWPLFGLRVVTPRLELRYLTDDEAADMADLAAAGVHDPSFMPFNHPWTDLPADGTQQRGSLQNHWRSRAEWTPDAWRLSLGCFAGGELVGIQGAHAVRFPVTRELSTGSWLGIAHQGRGIGTEMRQAILHLAFAGLGATQARSAALAGNHASLGVSRKLGYQPDGTALEAPRGEPVVQQRLLLTRERWERQRRDDIELVGLGPCLPLFGSAA